MASHVTVKDKVNVGDDKGLVMDDIYADDSH